MSATTAAAAIEEQLATLTGLDIYTGTVPTTPTRPHIVYYPAAGSPADRRMDGQARQVSAVARALCVNNHAHGALRVAQRVVDLMDGWSLSGHLVECWTGPLLSDPDMATGYRWSVTIEMAYTADR